MTSQPSTLPLDPRVTDDMTTSQRILLLQQIKQEMPKSRRARRDITGLVGLTSHHFARAHAIMAAAAPHNPDETLRQLAADLVTEMDLTGRISWCYDQYMKALKASDAARDARIAGDDPTLDIDEHAGPVLAKRAETEGIDGLSVVERVQLTLWRKDIGPIKNTIHLAEQVGLDRHVHLRVLTIINALKHTNPTIVEAARFALRRINAGENSAPVYVQFKRRERAARAAAAALPAKEQRTIMDNTCVTLQALRQALSTVGSFGPDITAAELARWSSEVDKSRTALATIHRYIKEAASNATHTGS